MAAHPRADPVQTITACLPRCARSGTTVPCKSIHTCGKRRIAATSPVIINAAARRAVYEARDDRQPCLPSGCGARLEQFAIISDVSAVASIVQKPTEDTPVQTVLSIIDLPGVNTTTFMRSVCDLEVVRPTNVAMTFKFIITIEITNS